VSEGENALDAELELLQGFKHAIRLLDTEDGGVNTAKKLLAEYLPLFKKAAERLPLNKANKVQSLSWNAIIRITKESGLFLRSLDVLIEVNPDLVRASAIPNLHFESISFPVTNHPTEIQAKGRLPRVERVRSLHSIFVGRNYGEGDFRVEGDGHGSILYHNGENRCFEIRTSRRGHHYRWTAKAISSPFTLPSARLSKNKETQRRSGFGEDRLEKGCVRSPRGCRYVKRSFSYEPRYYERKQSRLKIVFPKYA
jgi:hypothetical protein